MLCLFVYFVPILYWHGVCNYRIVHICYFVHINQIYVLNYYANINSLSMECSKIPVRTLIKVCDMDHRTHLIIYTMTSTIIIVITYVIINPTERERWDHIELADTWLIYLCVPRDYRISHVVGHVAIVELDSGQISWDLNPTWLFKKIQL